MILKNGVVWDGWEDHLKTILGSKNMALIKNAKFEVADRHTGLRDMSKAGGEFKLTKSVAPSVGCPIEFTWVDEKGAAAHIKYVEHTTKERVGDKVLDIEFPGSLYIIDGKFEVRKDKLQLFWFHMMSPYCENGFYTDTQWTETFTEQGGRQVKQTINRWGISKTVVDTTRMMRGTTGIFPKYKYVDETIERKAKIDKEKLRNKAREVVGQMSEEDMREMYGGPFGMPDSQTEDKDVIELFLLNKCNSDVDKDIKNILDADTEGISMLNLVNKCEELQVISYKKGERVWRFEGQTEHICMVTKGRNPTDYLVEWLRTKDDGKQVVTKMRESLKKAELVAA